MVSTEWTGAIFIWDSIKNLRIKRTNPNYLFYEESITRRCFPLNSTRTWIMRMKAICSARQSTCSDFFEIYRFKIFLNSMNLSGMSLV